ncbi:MAG: PDZ domain-containing protein [Oligoflexales bacterium]|nr:PDZ domain-containing protein [Oligoflexales bacterium]
MLSLYKYLYKNKFILILILMITIGVSLNLLIYRNKEKKYPEYPSEIEKQKIESEKEENENIEVTQRSLMNPLFLDSILSIIKNYYVDESVVDNKYLMGIALSQLSNDLDGSFTSKENSYSFAFHNDSIQLNISQNYGYQSFIKDAEKMSLFLDKHLSEIETTGYYQSSWKDNSEYWYSKGCFVFLNAMLIALDSHSSLLDASAYKELRQGTEGAFGGLGIVVGVRNNLLTVIKPLPNSPALKMGIKKHDKIMQIDGFDTFGVTLDNLVEHMRGAPGTRVDISLLRDGALSPVNISMVREIIQVNSVESVLVRKSKYNILHLVIESFSARTDRELRNAIMNTKEQLKGGQINGLILDLRSNPGGLLDQAVKVSDLFLRSGTIVTTKGRREEVELANNRLSDIDYPIAILINSESASASEIVAGALQDNNRAIVIGLPSFGKGSVQTIFELPGNQALKLTIARYYTPNGRSIQNVGILPDVWLQPVANQKTNNNLFGQNRFRNERFLQNSLNQGNEKLDKILRDRNMNQFKGYYLVNSINEFKESERGKDIELEFAIGLMERINQQYKGSLPDGTRRATHWLAVSSDYSMKELEKMTVDSKNWLKNKLNVNWENFSREKPGDDEISFSVTDTKGKEIGNNEVRKIGWKIKNKSSNPLARVSIFIRTDVAGNEPVEYLIGYIAPFEERSGNINFPISINGEHSHISIYAGVCSDLEIRPLLSRRLNYVVIQREQPQIAYGVWLFDDVKGNRDGILDKNEDGLLDIWMRNDGKVDANNVNVGLLNLSGNQISISSDKLKFLRIKSGETSHAVFTVKATDTLVLDKLPVGLNISYDESIHPIQKSIFIDANPSTSVARKSDLLSH